MIQAATTLIIDDDHAVREMIAGYLEDSGYNVLEAANGADGMNLCRRETPDLVLCDLRMPGMDGLEVLATLTRDFPETPIVMVSGLGGISDVIKALKLGAWDYVTKPIEDMAVLEHAIEQALERARLLRENRMHQEHLESVNRQLSQSLRQLQEDETAARRIQTQLLPERTQAFGPYRFSHQLFTSLYLSGDFVNYFAIDADHLGFYMADVAGHGVSSALVAVLLRSYMDRYLEAYLQGRDTAILEPAQVLAQLNRDIYQGRLEKYLTIFYGVIDCADNRLRYSNGGQFPFPLLWDGASSTFIAGKNLPIGLFDFAQYRSETLELPPHFAVALISDGILETLPQSNLREKQAFLLSLPLNAQCDIDFLTQQLGLLQTNELPDDITVLLITRAA